MRSKSVKRACYFGVVVLFSLFRIRLGLHSDETHTLAVAEQISRGDALFGDTWFYLQMSGVFSAPLIALYRFVNGGMDGVILFIRFITVIVSALISICFYSNFKNDYKEENVFVASLLLLMFVPDFQSVTYKQGIIWCSIIEIIFMYRYMQNKKPIYLYGLGFFIACSVLFYPTTIIILFMYLGVIIYYGRKEKMPKALVIKNCLRVGGMCAICGLAFMVYVLSKVNLQEFIYSFTKVFKDENLDSSFLTKLIHPFLKFLALGVVTVIPIKLTKKEAFEKKNIGKVRIFVPMILLLGAFGGQMYIQRSSITWHCITYPYALTVFLLPLAIKEMGSEQKQKAILLFEIPTVFVILSMALASNQGNITAMYGAVISAIGLVLVLGTEEATFFEKKEGKSITKALLGMACLIFCVFIYEQESVTGEMVSTRTVFSEREKVLKGPARGMYLSKEMYERHQNMFEIVSAEVQQEDRLFIVDDDFETSLGYLAFDGRNCTYSPQGGWGIADSQRPIDFFNVNHAYPTVIIISNDYINREIGDYLDNSLMGKFIVDNQYKLNVGEKYIVAKRKY